MEKWLCLGSLTLAGVLLLVFLLDLVVPSHFLFLDAKGGRVADVFAILCCALLGYLAWDASRDIR